MNIRTFFSEEQQIALIQSIKHAEIATSGEIRIHLDRTCNQPVFERALEVFNHLKMNETEQKNGVLFYLAIESHDFAIIGDQGINDLVPTNFWDEVKDLVIENFKKGDFQNGLSKGIELCGEKLRTHFPYQSDDINELTDEISFGE